MVRPDRTDAGDCDGSCCIELTGGSPVAVSAGAPRSRPRASRETLPSEWGVKSPRRAIWLCGGEQVRRPSIKRTLQPREINIRKAGLAEPLMSRRRQQTAPASRMGAGRPRGMEEGMRTGVRCGTGETRSRRPMARALPSSRQAKAVPISRRRKGIVPGGSPRGS